MRDNSDLTTQEYRRQVFDDLHLLAKTGYSPGSASTASTAAMSDPAGSVVAHGTLGFGDLSLMVKAGVQWGLFGGAVQLLGTRRHHERYLRDIMDWHAPRLLRDDRDGPRVGRSAPAHDGHLRPGRGRVRDQHAGQAARKDYIGNAARDGRMAVVFAQLIVDGAERGRACAAGADPGRRRATDARGDHRATAGARAASTASTTAGSTFRDVRVPREALLNRFGDVAEDGTYSSPIASDGRRFFTMIGTLIRGRISVAGTAGSATKRALAIAVRYGNTRRAVRPAGRVRARCVLLDYRAHQRKLLPALATTYALNFAQHELVAALADQVGAEGAAGTQRTASTQGTASARDCKHAAGCRGGAAAAGARGTRGGDQGGGHLAREPPPSRRAVKPAGAPAYLAENLLTTLKADTDVFTTFEGDNTVLLQLVAKGLLTNYQSDFEDLGTLATVRFMAEQFAGAVIERTAARGVIERLLAAGPGRDDEAVLFDRAWQVRAFEDREQHMLEGLARRLGAPPGPAIRSRCSTTPRTTCCARPARTSTGSCWRRSSRPSTAAPARTPGRCSTGSATCTCWPPSRRTWRGSWRTAG